MVAVVASSSGHFVALEATEEIAGAVRLVL
jgi:hypothetical protein